MPFQSLFEDYKTQHREAYALFIVSGKLFTGITEQATNMAHLLEYFFKNAAYKFRPNACKGSCFKLYSKYRTNCNIIFANYSEFFLSRVSKLVSSTLLPQSSLKSYSDFSVYSCVSCTKRKKQDEPFFRQT